MYWNHITNAKQVTAYQKVVALQDNVKEKVIGGLSSEHLMALMTDCCTSRTPQSYMTITANYIKGPIS